jgi:RNA polymerase sigma-70 factor, ECF subfamily
MTARRWRDVDPRAFGQRISTWSRTGMARNSGAHDRARIVVRLLLGGLARVASPWYGPAMPRSEETGEGAAGLDEKDIQLVRAAAKGDSHALAGLYDRYASCLLAVGQRILGTRREAEDLLHDVFLEVWRHAGDYDRTRGSVRAWLLMRMRSRALDRRRAQGRARVVLLDNGKMPEHETAALDDPSLAPDRRVVRKAIAELPKDQRVVLELGYFEGLTSTEIAERVEIPVGTVKSRVARALSQLRASLVVGEGGRKK